MIKHLSVTALLLSAAVVSAEQTRQMEAHEHGVGQLNIAIEGTRIAIELEAPGADIVGFEYKAKSSEDRAKIDAAIAVLAQPLDLFVLPLTLRRRPLSHLPILTNSPMRSSWRCR
jgi:hypothetical protein